jgi:hypothetical protein
MWPIFLGTFATIREALRTHTEMYMITETEKMLDTLTGHPHLYTAPAAGASTVKATLRATGQGGNPQLITHLCDVAQLVLRQIETVHTAKMN